MREEGEGKRRGEREGGLGFLGRGEGERVEGVRERRGEKGSEGGSGGEGERVVKRTAVGW